MSFDIKLSSLSKDVRDELFKTLIIKPPPSQYDPHPKPYHAYVHDKNRDIMSLPLGLWPKVCNTFPNNFTFDKMNRQATFTKSLLTVETDPDGRGRDQDVIVKTALERLDRCGAVFLSLPCGQGKTGCAIYMSVALGLKTVILTHLDVVKQQWAEEYQKFTNNVKIQFLNQTNCKLDPTADVYIVGIQKANLCDLDFSTIGTVIIDEAHIATITAFTQTLFKFNPRYLIGLSATPDRPDGMGMLFNLYFGTNEEFIIRKEKKQFIVYKVETDYVPTIEYTIIRGKRTVNWSTVVQSIESNPKRWQLIVDIVLCNPKHKIIILCNRKVLSNGVYDLLLKNNQDAELLIESKKTWNKQARVLVAGFKKGGVGLNDPQLTMAIIASDTKDARQYEGRIRTVNNVIYHLVDYYQPLHTHYKECQKFYIEKGATIKKINKYHLLIPKYYYKYLLLKHLDTIYDVKNYILTHFVYLVIDI
jgi:hypothetical protein